MLTVLVAFAVFCATGSVSAAPGSIRNEDGGLHFSIPGGKVSMIVSLGATEAQLTLIHYTGVRPHATKGVWGG